MRLSDKIFKSKFPRYAKIDLECAFLGSAGIAKRHNRTSSLAVDLHRRSHDLSGVPKDLVQNPDFGKPGSGPEPTHLWVDRPEPNQWLEVPPSGGTDPGPLGIIFLPVVLLAFLPLAYPILTVAVFATWWVCRELCEARFRGMADGPKLALLIVPALVVFVIGMRIEQRLGAHKLYRWPRHLLRLLLPALAMIVIALDQNDQVPTDPDFFSFVRHIFRDSELLIGLIVMMVVMQILYWIGGWVRDWWHAFLRTVWLRSKKLKD